MVLHNEVETLKKEIEFLKKDRSTTSKIPTRRLLVPTPPQKPSSQKKTKEIFQNDSINVETASATNGDHQEIQIKQVIDFIQKTMLTLSEYEKHFQSHLNTEMTQMEM